MCSPFNFAFAGLFSRTSRKECKCVCVCAVGRINRDTSEQQKIETLVRRCEIIHFPIYAGVVDADNNKNNVKKVSLQYEHFHGLIMSNNYVVHENFLFKTRKIPLRKQ